MADSQAAAIAERLRAEMAAAASALTLEVTANLTEACPVDTGHAHWNFIPAIGDAFAGEVQDASGQAAGIVAVAAYRFGDGPLSITNNVPYIDRLIGGWSSQAPVGWDLAAIDAAQQTIQARYDGLQIDVTTGDTGASVKIAPRNAG